MKMKLSFFVLPFIMIMALNVEAAILKDHKKAFSCIRELVEKKAIDQDSTIIDNEVILTLKSLVTENDNMTSDKDKLKVFTKSCKKLIKNEGHLSDDFFHNLLADEVGSNQKKTLNKIGEMVLGFRRSTANDFFKCHGVRTEVKVGVLWAGGLGAQTFVCEGTDGRKRLFLGASAAKGVGIGALAKVQELDFEDFTNDEESDSPKKILSVTQNANEADWAIVIGRAASFKKYNGFSAGLGLMITEGESLNLQIMSLGTNWNKLIERYEIEID